MDLRHSESEERFRSQFRGWLDEHLPDEMRKPSYWTSKSYDEAFEIRRRWETDKAAAGFAGIQWPVEFGGRGGTPGMKAIYDQEMALAGAPHTVNPLGLTFLAPTVMQYGTEQQKREIIPAILHNREIWCQGFSEPGAGSDLAAVSTRAQLDGDEWVLNGQKVWTTHATKGDKIFVLARTAAADAKHRGLSMLLVDMHQPGVEARPLKQLSGASEFGEVFFTDARCPADSVLGPVGEGWRVAMVLLSFERGSSAIGQYTAFRRSFDEIAALAHDIRRGTHAAARDPELRQRLGRVLTDLECLKYHSWHVLSQTSQGNDLGFGASLTKLMWSETMQDLFEVYADVVGPEFQVSAAAGHDLSALQLQALWSRSVTIWGGSSQVQRNVVAERILGLPR